MVGGGGFLPLYLCTGGRLFPGAWEETITASLRGQMIFQPGALRGDWLLAFTAIFGTAELMTRRLTSETEIRLMVLPLLLGDAAYINTSCTLVITARSNQMT